MVGLDEVQSLLRRSSSGIDEWLWRRAVLCPGILLKKKRREEKNKFTGRLIQSTLLDSRHQQHFTARALNYSYRGPSTTRIRVVSGGERVSFRSELTFCLHGGSDLLIMPLI